MWPSGLRCWFKAPVSSEAWVPIPSLPSEHFALNRKKNWQVITELRRYTKSFTFLGAEDASKTLFYFANFRSFRQSRLFIYIYKKNRHKSSWEKDYTPLGIERFFFFGKKVFKTSSGSFSILSYVFDSPNGKSCLKSNFSNDCWNTAS